ncbi:MAG: ATP-binding cassette domain-containing protein [Myxococcota bacterium]
MSAEHTLDITGRIVWPGLDLEVDVHSRADRIALVGSSGSGKSSLLRCIAGLQPVQALDIAFRGTPWSDRAGLHRASRDRNVGWVPQHAELFPHLNAFENLCFGGSERSARQIADALELENVLEQTPNTLSGGERQRVALGRALNREPDLLLLDEPFAALDRKLRGRVKSWLLETCERRSLPFVIVTHDQRDVSEVADEVWKVASGEVVLATDR